MERPLPSSGPIASSTAFSADSQLVFCGRQLQPEAMVRTGSVSGHTLGTVSCPPHWWLHRRRRKGQRIAVTARGGSVSGSTTTALLTFVASNCEREDQCPMQLVRVEPFHLRSSTRTTPRSKSNKPRLARGIRELYTPTGAAMAGSARRLRQEYLRYVLAQRCYGVQYLYPPLGSLSPSHDSHGAQRGPTKSSQTSDGLRV